MKLGAWSRMTTFYRPILTACCLSRLRTLPTSSGYKSTAGSGKGPTWAKGLSSEWWMTMDCLLRLLNGRGLVTSRNLGVNNKVIRAIQLLGGRRTGFSLIDITGHGTRATSTAAGNIVKNVNILGNANGTAAGTALYAHLAIYQVCDFRVCYGVDILARVDVAIKDGVDVLYLALGSSFLPFDADKIATGDFSAIEKEILVIDPSGRW